MLLFNECCKLLANYRYYYKGTICFLQKLMSHLVTILFIYTGEKNECILISSVSVFGLLNSRMEKPRFMVLSQHGPLLRFLGQCI